jgi:glycosyltransferase involved in cell wall biosynthesis
MHILVFHQFYIFAGAPGGSRFNEFARIWTDMGHQVTVVAGTVNYATGEIPAKYDSRIVTRERDGAVDVVRAWVPKSFSAGYAGRAVGFGGFAASATAAIVGMKRPDVVIATSPPLPIALPGLIAATRFNAPLVFEVRDLWPESAVTTGVIPAESALTTALYALERQAYAHADRINVLTPAFREDILARGLAPDRKIWFIPNGADADAFVPGPADPDLRRELGWGDRFVAMYAGAHGKANALHQLVEAAGLLRDHPEVLIACVGDGPERRSLERLAESRGLDNIRFHGAFPKEQMPALVRACDVGLAVLQDNPTFRTVYPNKVFDYMSCERATILAIDGVARKMVCEDARAGVFVPPERADSLAQALLDMNADPQRRRDLGRNGALWVRENVRRDALAKKYLDLLEQLVRDKSAGRP